MYVNGNPILFTDPSGNFCLGGGSGPCTEYDDIAGYEGYDDYQNIPRYESDPYKEFLWRNLGVYSFGCPSLSPGGEYHMYSPLTLQGFLDLTTSTEASQWIFNNSDDLMDLDISLLRLFQLEFTTNGHEYFVSGGPGSFALKEDLGMVPNTTHARTDHIYKFIKTTDESWISATGRNARAAMNSGWTLFGTALDAFQDWHDPNYNPNENDNGWIKYGTAVTYDFVANAASAAVSGATYTAVATGVAYGLGVAATLGVSVAAAPAIAVGAGIIAGAYVGIRAKNYIDNNYKESIVNYVAGATENAWGTVSSWFGG